MRHVGRITEWNDARGFGFVTPHNGGTRAFVHIKAFPFGSRRPVDGDLVSYALTKDERGRSHAVDVRHAGQKRVVRKPARARAGSARRKAPCMLSTCWEAGPVR